MYHVIPVAIFMLAAAGSSVDSPGFAANAEQGETVAPSIHLQDVTTMEALVKASRSDEEAADQIDDNSTAENEVVDTVVSAAPPALSDNSDLAAKSDAMADEAEAIAVKPVANGAFSRKLVGEEPAEQDGDAHSDTAGASGSETATQSEGLSADSDASPPMETGGASSAIGRVTAPSPQPEIQPKAAADLRLLGSIVKPGTAARLGWSPKAAISGLEQPTPVLVVHGAKPGPVLCLTSAVHGDELNGIEVVRGVMYDLDPAELSGTVIGVPIVNLQGFQRGSRYLSDRRDLNRYFPGYASGSMASRIADSLFRQVISQCDMLVDIHTGSLRRANLPQLRANMRSEAVVEFTKGFDNMIVVHSMGAEGMLRSAATKIGIPAVTLEIGESLRIQRKEIKAGIHGINSLLEKQDMYERIFIWGEPRPVFYNSTWLRTERGGILESHVELGDSIAKGDSLGVVIDPITNKGTDIVSAIRGRVIGMAVDQVVMPGFATYHIGMESSERALGFQSEIQGTLKDAEPPTVE